MGSYPHRQQSPVRGTAISLRILWCMRCFRESVTAFDPNLQKPLVINCCMDATGAHRCRDCFRADAQCHQASTGMLGDAEDLMKVLDQVTWLAEFPESQNTAWKSSVIVAYWRAVQQLFSAFSSAELAHQQFHWLDLAISDRVRLPTYLA
ncbi:uncharacterized protein BDV14DRAFT_104595 [Aspergillus stella-maris]|uniref:uncharacterized protein n=1 Tax=Aspergillus stella-maris TaxID=1810926 RepID=UPI003CCD2D50